MCALVSRNWLPSSRFHLLRSTVIMSEVAFDRLAHNVKVNPELALLFNTITLVSLFPTFDTFSRIIDFVRSTPVLTTLVIANIDWPEETAYPEKPLLSHPLSNLILTGCIFSDNVGFANCLRSFTSLKHLSIEKTATSYQPSDNELPATTSASRPKLSVGTLHLAFNAATVEDPLLAILDVQSPRELYFECDEAEHLGALFRLCGRQESQIARLYVAASFSEDLGS